MKDGDMGTDILDNTTILAAQNGDAKALEDVVRHVQDRVHRLAIRMMYDPEHALDATQEILIRVVTKLSTFRGESSFETWVYRVALNTAISWGRKENSQREKKQGLAENLHFLKETSEPPK